jgi:hypothetical protein
MDSATSGRADSAVTFGEVVAVDITTWSPVDQNPTGITRGVPSLGEVCGRGGREQLLSTACRQFVIDSCRSMCLLFRVIVSEPTGFVAEC